MKKKLLCGLAVLSVCLLSSCGNKQRDFEKEIIYQNLPFNIWADQAFEEISQMHKELSSSLEEFANDKLSQFESDAIDSEIDLYASSAFWGLDDLYLLGSSSREKKNQTAINNYKAKYKQLDQNLLDGFQSSLDLRAYSEEDLVAYRDSRDYSSGIVEIFINQNADYCWKYLLGTPSAPSKVSNAEQLQFTEFATIWTLLEMERPSIASTEYNKQGKYWTVRMDAAPTQYVKFYQRDDDSIDAEYGTRVSSSGEILSPETMVQAPNAHLDADEDVYDPDESQTGPRSITTVSEYIGRLYDNSHSYNILFELTVEEGWGADIVYDAEYKYASHPEANPIHLNLDETETDNLSSDETTDIVLVSEGGTEKFDLALNGDYNEPDSITGKWIQTDKNTGAVKRTLSVELKKK